MTGAIFEKGIFNPERIADKRTIAVLNAAIDRSTMKVRPSDILAAAIESGDARIHAIFMQVLEPGSSSVDLKDLINVYNKARSTPNTDFDGKKECFSIEMLEALDQFDHELSNLKDEKCDASLELLISCIISNLDANDKDFLTILNVKNGVELFRKTFEDCAKPLNPLFDEASNRLRSDEFSESAWTSIEYAGIRASDMGYDHIMPPHCFLALLGETEGVTEHLVRLQAPPEIGLGKVADMVVEAFRLSNRKKDTILLTRDSFAEATVELMRIAQKKARFWSEEQINTLHLLAALLEAIPPRLASVLERSPLNIDLGKMRQHLNLQLSEYKTQEKKEIAFRLPSGMLPSEDLTYKARTKSLSEALPFDSKCLFSWDEIPKNDSEKLKDFLKERFGIEWIKILKIEKIDNVNTIKVSNERNSILLKLNNEKTKLTLEIDDGRTDELIAKTEKGKLNIYDSDLELMIKGLYRRSNNNIIVTGQRGVGKTTRVWELARRAATGAIPFLKRKRFLWVDSGEVWPKESKDKLEGIIAYVANRTDLILCIDGLGSLLRAESGGNNKIILRSALKDKRINLIGIMSKWDFDDLISSDHELLESFTIVNVEEPKKEASIDIVKKASIDLEKEYRVTIEEKAAERAVILSSDYILNERLPAKAIKILRRVCEDIDYERTQRKKIGPYLFCWDEIPGNESEKLIDFLRHNFNIDWAKAEKIQKMDGDHVIKISSEKKTLSINLNSGRNEANLTIDDSKTSRFITKLVDGKLNIHEDLRATASDVIKVISEMSGVPEGTLSGLGDKEINYKNNLSLEVIGQDEAVEVVAKELTRIKSGGTEPGKPASVMFFAGLTGTGKTELAKTLARFYSSSKRLQTYTMGNFTQSHTISGIIGVPPGYVGYDQGGRLINDLNSDPYCVFLLDEAEKAHPDIWKPFLNLFDEGWVVDQRGVKAFADRAIFILTSNAGNEIISKMSMNNAHPSEINKAVNKALLEITRDGEPVFSPEFLGRFGHIIVFKPLDEDAMKGICKKMVARMIKDWSDKREKKIVVPENLIEYISYQSHYDDKESGFKKGGRIVRRKIRDLIELPIQNEITNNSREYNTCNNIKLTFLSPDSPLPYQQPTEPKVAVEFLTERNPSPAECMAQVVASLKQDLSIKKITPNSIHLMVLDSLARLDTAINRWKIEHTGESSVIPEGLLDQFRKACSDIENLASRSEKESQVIVENLIAVLERGKV